MHILKLSQTCQPNTMERLILASGLLLEIEKINHAARTGVVSNYIKHELRRMFPLYEFVWLMNTKLWKLAFDFFENNNTGKSS